MKKSKPKTLHETLLARLGQMQGHHVEIARETGIAQATVSRIYHGAMPRLDTAEKLLGWFERYDAKAARRVGRSGRAGARAGAAAAGRRGAARINALAS